MNEDENDERVGQGRERGGVRRPALADDKNRQVWPQSPLDAFVVMVVGDDWPREGIFVSLQLGCVRVCVGIGVEF